MSPKFFSFAKKVFDGEAVEERITKDGETIFIQASVGDRVYLWEKLAAYGFGKPASEMDISGITAPLQKVINDTALLKMLYAINYPDGRGTSGSGAPVVAAGNSPLQTGATAA